MKYSETINEILKEVGGLSNIENVTHCATRLRFKISDEKVVNLKEIQKLPLVLGARIAEGNELQTIIGTDVGTAYDEFMEITNFNADYSDNKSAKKTSVNLSPKKIGSMIIEYISGTVAPVIPIYLGAGMLMAFLTICTNFLGLNPNSGTVVILNSAANAGFYFMPIVLGWSAANKLKADPSLGALLGMTLLASDINNKAGLDFLGLPISKVQYNGSFLPMLLGAAFLALVYRFFKNKIPQSIRYFLLPLVTLLISIPVTLIVLGPIGYLSGTGLMWLLNLIASHFKILAMAIWGLSIPLSIITGMDKAVYFINMEHLNTVGYDNIFLPGGLAGNAAIAGAALAVWFISKNTKIKSIGATSGITALVGITEPALYGILINFRTAFFGAMTGSAIGSVFAGLINLKQYVYAGPGLATSAVYISPNGNMTNFILCLVTIGLSTIAGFGATYLFSLKDKTQFDGEISENTSNNNIDMNQVNLTKDVNLYQISTGELKKIEDVPDPVFSEKMMGDGYAVQPSGGDVFSPVSGTVVTVADTKHAIGIKSENNLEVLVHMGLDTVSLEGQGFDIPIKVGDKVNNDTIIAKINRQVFHEKQKNDIIMVVITNMDQVNEIKWNQNSNSEVHDLVAKVKLN